MAKALAESGGGNGARSVQGTLRCQVYTRRNLGGQLSLRRDTAEGSLRCMWHSADQSVFPCDQCPSHATAPSAPFLASRALREKGLGPSARLRCYRKTTLSSSATENDRSLQEHQEGMRGHPSLPLTSSRLGKLLRTSLTESHQPSPCF